MWSVALDWQSVSKSLHFIKPLSVIIIMVGDRPWCESPKWPFFYWTRTGTASGLSFTNSESALNKWFSRLGGASAVYTLLPCGFLAALMWGHPRHEFQESFSIFLQLLMTDNLSAASQYCTRSFNFLAPGVGVRSHTTEVGRLGTSNFDMRNSFTVQSTVLAETCFQRKASDNDV